MWNLKDEYVVGGLLNIGYASGSDMLMVLSSQGQGIFNCLTGEKVARLHNDMNWDGYNTDTNMIPGFDCLEGETIHTSGSEGGDQLLKTTKDGWSLMVSDPIPIKEIPGNYFYRQIFIKTPAGDKTIFVADERPHELRVFGFSETGLSFIVATSGMLTIYSRTSIE